MPSRNHSIIQLHSAVLLFGFAGLLGKLITESPIVIVFGRTALAASGLFLILRYRRTISIPEQRRDIFGFIGLGMLLTFHWLSFFQSIKISTVAIGLLTYASFPVFVTILESLIFHQRLKWPDMLLSVIVMIGLLIIVPEYTFSNTITLGVVWGVLSGFSFALLTVINKVYADTYSALNIAFYQNGIAALILLPFALMIPKALSVSDIGYIFLLGIFCTALAHTLFIHSMRQIRAFTAGIAAGMEPVYGIMLALLILGEIPALRTVIGGVIILAVVGFVSCRSD
ncbi:MAG: EamA family transporter [Candidatus Marinimicrobia bacterium]|nr:EamA family transporter [Candidatus Neomarinimicrobiota bacterium]